MSDWKKSAAVRRDARNTKPEAQTPKVRSSKNTKRWCRGKAGVEHETECRPFVETKNWGVRPEVFAEWRLLVCKLCGKELARYAPIVTHRSIPKPAWVTS